MSKYLLWLISFITFLSTIETISKYPILIVISFDAFRYDYINSTNTPYLYSIRTRGAYSHHITSIFPTKTYPNHFSIATGLYANVHGVTGNSLYCPKAKKILTYSYELFHYNEQVEPVWIRNEKMGKGRHSGVIMWPGGIYSYQNVTPTFTMAWNDTIDLKKRMETAVNWITHEETPANLVFMYLEETDNHAHAFGIYSETFYTYLRSLDDAIKHLDNLLIQNGIQNNVNIIQTSDHGMINVKPINILNITQHLDPNDYQIAETSPFLHFIPAEGKEQMVYESLENMSHELPHFRVFKRNDLPDRWHLKGTDRCPPIIALADENYVFQDFQITIQKYEAYFGRPVNPMNDYGIHGYDNTELNMAGYFMARGPQIRENFEIPPFHIIDLYNVFCWILQIPPAPNNGSFNNVVHILKTPVVDESKTLLSFLAMGAIGVILTVLCLGCVGSSMLCMMRKKRQNEGISLAQKRYMDEIDIALPALNLRNVETQQLLISDSDDS